MIDYAHIESDIKLEEMEKRIRQIYTRTGKEIRVAWKEYLDVVNKEIEAAQKEYDEAKKSGDKDLIRKKGAELAAIKREKTMMTQRYDALVEQTTAQITNANQTAVAYLNGEMPNIYALNYTATQTEIAETIHGTSFTLTDEYTVKRLIVENDRRLLPNLPPERMLNIPADRLWNQKKINAEILQGILQGESMGKIANRLQNVTDMNAKAAIRNARTMVTGAENAGRIDGMKAAQKSGIILKKEWLSTDDKRTRHWHRELNGVEKDVDEPFQNAVGDIMYPGDPSADGANVYNCRCTLITKVKGFK